MEFDGAKKINISRKKFPSFRSLIRKIYGSHGWF
jgi:hypothetical protein